MIETADLAEEESASVDIAKGSWVARAEAAIRALRDVEAANIQAAGEEIREIHVLARSRRPAKQIVRDVQTVLMTRFNRAIDHRVVSVAFNDSAPAPVAPVEAARGDDAPAGAERIRFESVNLFVSGARTQAQVELRWKGLPRIGSASGLSTREDSHRLVASATVAAIQEFLTEQAAVGVQAVEVVPVGKRIVAVVVLTLMAQRQARPLTGCCPIEHDTPQAVVLATLAALNRVVGGLNVKEPTEYVLRPTST